MSLLSIYILRVISLVILYTSVPISAFWARGNVCPCCYSFYHFHCQPPRIVGCRTNLDGRHCDSQHRAVRVPPKLKGFYRWLLPRRRGNGSATGRHHRLQWSIGPAFRLAIPAGCDETLCHAISAARTLPVMSVTFRALR